MYRRGLRGFTLIELLVVIAIIGLLASIVLVSLNQSRAKARDSMRLSDLRALGQALELHKLIKGHYPIAVNWISDCDAPSGNWIPDGTDYNWYLPHLAKVPRDPKPDCASDPKRTYQYKSDGTSYTLTTKLEQKSGPGSTGRAYDGLAFIPFDLGGPLLASFSSVSSPTNLSPIPFTLAFSRAVFGFAQGSLSVINGFVNGVVAVSTSVYNIFVVPTDNGPISVSIGSGQVEDIEGTTNDAADITVIYDSLRPHVALTPDPLPSTVSGAFVVSLNTTVAVTDFSASSVSVTNGTVSNAQEIAPNNGRNYSFTVTPQGPGPVTIIIPEGVLHSAANNSSVASNSLDTVAQ